MTSPPGVFSSPCHFQSWIPQIVLAFIHKSIISFFLYRHCNCNKPHRGANVKTFFCHYLPVSYGARDKSGRASNLYRHFPRRGKQQDCAIYCDLSHLTPVKQFILLFCINKSKTSTCYEIQMHSVFTWKCFYWLNEKMPEDNVLMSLTASPSALLR